MTGRIFCHLISPVGEFTTEPIVRFLRHVRPVCSGVGGSARAPGGTREAGDRGELRMPRATSMRARIIVSLHSKDCAHPPQLPDSVLKLAYYPHRGTNTLIETTGGAV